MGDFKKLNVWFKAKELAVYIYALSDKGLLSKDYGLRDQMRRSAVSVVSNIAEGDQLGTNPQSIRHFYIARGSVAELYTQAIIANEIKYISKIDFENIENSYNDISKMLTKLIKVRLNSSKPTRNT